MIKKAIFGTVVVCSAIAYSHTSKADVNISKQIAEKQIECLAAIVYHESRGESMAGQLAVALVTNNRKNDIRFPNTYCDVVYEGPRRESWKTKQLDDIPASDRIYYPVKHKCQFSWYCDGKSDKVLNEYLWKNAYMVAAAVAQGVVYDFTDGATHYNADYVSPNWAKRYHRIVKIDQHIFYRTRR